LETRPMGAAKEQHAMGILQATQVGVSVDVKNCFVCGAAMVREQLDESRLDFETFECLRCGSLVTYDARRSEPKTGE
jgi:ferredoxin-like protein FixX